MVFVNRLIYNRVTIFTIHVVSYFLYQVSDLFNQNGRHLVMFQNILFLMLWHLFLLLDNKQRLCIYCLLFH